MFSKEDYIKYFLQIRKVELTMRDRFLGYSKAVDDQELKEFFFSLHREENAHYKIVTGMLETFDYKETQNGQEGDVK